MATSLQDLNKRRKPGYRKDSSEETFLLEMNRMLQERETSLYRDYSIEHPFLFVFGLPRSGTTLITQLIAHSFDIGYINNLMARFWLAPLHGIRLSRNVLGTQKQITFQSDYARTPHISDIHEFGYFWRHWLKKETLDDITRVREREGEIDWVGLRRVLANIQHEFGRAMVFKNILGSYHVQKLNQVLQKVLYIYIRRDPLDVAVSILEARKKYYSDLNTWWSYVPVEYDLLKDLDYWKQIAGQVYFLKRFYHNQLRAMQSENYLEIDYRAMCQDPKSVIETIQQKCAENFGHPLKRDRPAPSEFPYRYYQDRTQDKQKFSKLLQEFENTYGSE